MDAEQLASLKVEFAQLYVDIPRAEKEWTSRTTTDPRVLAWTTRLGVIARLISEHYDTVLALFDEAREQVSLTKDSKDGLLESLAGADERIAKAEDDELDTWQELRDLAHYCDRKPPTKPGPRPIVRRGQMTTYSDMPRHLT